MYVYDGIQSNHVGSVLQQRKRAENFWIQPKHRYCKQNGTVL